MTPPVNTASLSASAGWRTLLHKEVQLLACRRHAQAHGKTLHVVQWPAKLQSLAQVYGVLEWLSTPQDKSVAHAAASAV